MGYNKDTDNVDTKELQPILREFLENLSGPFEADYDSINELEYQSRDGFIASSSNHGGLDLLKMASVPLLIGRGEHFGLAIEDKVNEFFEYLLKCIKEDNPELSDDEVHEKAYEEANEYDDIAWRVRLLYRGDNTLDIFVGYDFDAPYFRWYGPDILETTIMFNDNEDLRKQLEDITDKINNAI
jgi:hypothetical protein